MGREVRRVPAEWQHPADGKYFTGAVRYIPLLDDFPGALASYKEDRAAWERGEFPEYASDDMRAMPFEKWAGKEPNPENYMPLWSQGERTHFMMYETCSEGTPISPAFTTPEELARWLADTGASAFGAQGASYEKWLSVARGRSAGGCIIYQDGSMVSGVEYDA